jgi:hypothetical protein
VRIDHHGDDPVPFESNVMFSLSSRFWNEFCDWSLG